MQQAWFDYLIILLYLAAVIGIGVYFSRGEKSSENYLLGGRNMPFLAVGIACMMSLLSSVSIVMVPGEIFNNGLTLFSLSGTVGLLLVIPCYLLFTRFYFRLGSFTPYEYLEYRYDSTVRAVVAFSAFYTRTMYLAMVLYTTAKIFQATYAWPPWFSILLVGVVGIVYTVMGGTKAVVWTDVLQFFVLAGGFAVVVTILCGRIDGGAAEAVAAAFRDGHGMPQFSQPEFYGLSPYVRLLFWLLLWGAVVTPLTTSCSDQITIQRLLSTRNWKEGFKSQCVATVSGVLFTFVLWFTGLAIYTYYRQNPDPALGPGSGDAAFFHFVSTQLPSPVPGLFMAAMLAAIMSTLSSGMNSMAAVWLKEIHQKFINRNLAPSAEVTVSKYATLLIGVFAVGLALALELSGQWLTQSVSEVGTIFYLIGAAILPAFLFAVLSSRANAKLIWGYTAFAFGEGLSYTTFAYGEPTITGGASNADGTFAETDTVRAEITLTNTGERAGVEIMQAYIGDIVTSYSWTDRELKAFQRVALEPGETKTVTFEIPVANCTIVDPDANRIVEPGEFELLIGHSSRREDLKCTTFTVA